MLVFHFKCQKAFCGSELLLFIFFSVVKEKMAPLAVEVAPPLVHVIQRGAV